jgi:flagellar biosynthetic protein FliR
MTLSTPYFQTLILVFVRAMGFVMAAPVLSSRLIPAQVKIGLCGLLALLLAPTDPSRLADYPADNIAFSLVAAQELAVGALVGLTSNLIFNMMQMAGQLLGLSIGFSMAYLFDPLSGTQQSNVDQMFLIVGTLIFLALDGHHGLVLGLGQSFRAVPPATFVFSGQTAESMLLLISQLFGLALRIALPVMGTLLLTDVVLAIISRVMPQMSIFFIEMPLKVALGLFTLMLALPGMIAIFIGLTTSTQLNILNVLGKAP